MTQKTSQFPRQQMVNLPEAILVSPKDTEQMGFQQDVVASVIKEGLNGVVAFTVNG